MERKTTSAGEFEEAIKNFSKLSLEVDALIDAGNVDAHRLMNKSIENRNEAISSEAAKRLKSFEVEQKETKSNEASKAHGSMEELFFEEVKMEFDKCVEEQRIQMRGNSATDVSKNVENKKSENADDDDGSKKDSSEDEESEDESEEDSDDTETTEKDSSEEESSEGGDSEGGDSDDDESTEDEEKAEAVDSSKK